MEITHFDPEEIEKFEAMADEWWSPTGKFKPLHQLNPLRLDYIFERIVDGTMEADDLSILDVGCGGGLLAENMALRGACVTGVDRSEKALAVAQAHADRSAGLNLTYHCSDAETWAQTYAVSYDVITCLEVLEHVPDVVRTLQACQTMLKPGGKLFFATLNRTPKSYLHAILGAEYLLGWLPKKTHRYDQFIRPSEMVYALRQADLQVVDMQGVSYDFLQGTFFLSQDLSVNYLGMAIKAID
ncbi:MAG: bifunctional 2-polyprenyl-6-hydroxyphenol methylase/3-demethylubiquinol 3-O-methyltransferase UbiG [Zetaproteobacteria bacterium]|nr:bifunctional 2-polyprenyl-6-hydroxyphenol methylase/3-demethylubiquinol 3-O-methyltransferase UbiG [Zetaproteobacteria bacterium]